MTTAGTEAGPTTAIGTEPDKTANESETESETGEVVATVTSAVTSAVNPTADVNGVLGETAEAGMTVDSNERTGLKIPVVLFWPPEFSSSTRNGNRNSLIKNGSNVQ